MYDKSLGLCQIGYVVCDPTEPYFDQLLKSLQEPALDGGIQFCCSCKLLLLVKTLKGECDKSCFFMDQRGKFLNYSFCNGVMIPIQQQIKCRLLQFQAIIVSRIGPPGASRSQQQATSHQYYLHAYMVRRCMHGDWCNQPQLVGSVLNTEQYQGCRFAIDAFPIHLIHPSVSLQSLYA